MVSAFFLCRMHRKGKAFQILLTVIAALIAAEGQFWFPAAKVQWAIDDWMELFGRKSQKRPELIFLAVDDSSARLEPDVDLPDFLENENAKPEESRALELMAGKSWPWSREVTALVIDRLVAAGAKSVVLDFTFPKPGPGDDALRAAIERHADRVIVAGNFVDGGRDRNTATNEETTIFSVPAETVVPAALRARQVIGFDNFWAYPDGRIRSVRYAATLENQVGPRRAEDETVFRSLAVLAVEKAGFPVPPSDDRRPRHMRFAGGPRTFNPLPLYEIFVPRYWRANYGAGKFFDGKIVVVGAYGNWQQDEHATPFGIMPGPEIHLNAINSLLNRDTIRELPPWPRRYLVYAAASLVLFLASWISRPFLRLIASAGIAACWVMLAFRLFNEGGLLVPAVYDADCKGVGEIAAAVREIVELAKARRVSRELLEDSTFTISNLGMFGIEDFDPLVNPPQAAILGVGAGVAGPERRTRIRMTMGCDHRVLTGAEGAPFLGAVTELLERPEALTAAPAPLAAAEVTS